MRPIVFVVHHSQYPTQSAQQRHSVTHGRVLLCFHLYLRYCVSRVVFAPEKVRLGVRGRREFMLEPGTLRPLPVRS